MKLRWTYALIAVFVGAIASLAQTSTQFTSVATGAPLSHARSFTANEPHIQSETLGILYANSAFAHGYRHGYEQGFHVGDLDIHMGRNARIAVKSSESGRASREYQLSFGNRQLFHEGYAAGFHTGYADAISGVEFRATERAKTAIAGLTDILPNTRRAHFDEGFAAGYKSAQSQHAPVAHINVEYVEHYCRQTVTNLYSLEYCSGFGRGYVLGISGTSPDHSSIATSQRAGR